VSRYTIGQRIDGGKITHLPDEEHVCHPPILWGDGIRWRCDCGQEWEQIWEPLPGPVGTDNPPGYHPGRFTTRPWPLKTAEVAA
jgi:hypothetical protein